VSQVAVGVVVVGEVVVGGGVVVVVVGVLVDVVPWLGSDVVVWGVCA
jgi:hypothetical protein